LAFAAWTRGGASAIADFRMKTALFEQFRPKMIPLSALVKSDKPDGNVVRVSRTRANIPLAERYFWKKKRSVTSEGFFARIFSVLEISGQLFRPWKAKSG
jgi:hypothetical protein